MPPSQVTVNPQTYLFDALDALEQQADQEQLRLRPLSTVAEIGEHVFRVEAAQAAI
jgi:hypothetical protein